VAVPGAACSASTLVGLGEAILASSGDDGGEPACWFVAVDLPAHGESPPPVGALFGDLHFSDYPAALLGTLDRLEARGIDTTTLIGHSLGGAVVLLAQQRLVDAGSSLRAAYGVKHLVGLAPGAWPQGIPCAICQNPQIGAALGQFAVDDPVLGPALELPVPVWLGFVFSELNGTLAPHAPSPAEVVSLGYDSPESMTVIGEDFGAPTPLGPGIFGHGSGTKLDVISFQNDTLVPPPEGEALYQYLTGESPETGWTLVADGGDAVHGMPISDPAEMLAALEGRVAFP
jgi:pimeloyl-ACP methyl ester carboxylesterase